MTCKRSAICLGKKAEGPAADNIKAACLVPPVKALFCLIVIKDRGKREQYVSQREKLCGSSGEEGRRVVERGEEGRGGGGE